MKKTLLYLSFCTLAFLSCTKKSDDPKPSSTNNTQAPTTGGASFWARADLGVGNITVYVAGQYAGIISHYNSSGINCGSADVNVTKSPGTYNWNASATDGSTWSGTVTITVGGCFPIELTSSNSGGGGNGGGGGGTGNAVFFIFNDLGHGALSVYVDNQYVGQITHTNPDGIGCGNGDVNITKSAGSHTWYATASDGARWEGTFDIIANNCNKQMITSAFQTSAGSGGSSGGGGGSGSNGNVAFWVHSDLHHGNITVYVANQYAGSITQYHPDGLSSCSNANVNVSKAPGTYNWNASAPDGYTWSGTVAITAGGCFQAELK